MKRLKGPAEVLDTQDMYNEGNTRTFATHLEREQRNDNIV
jgi:hypothetical protein